MRLKKLKIKSLNKFLIVFLLLMLNGCSSTKFQDSISSLDDFSKKYHCKMIEYIEKDKSLSIRDKNTFYIELKNYNEHLEKIKEYFLKK